MTLTEKLARLRAKAEATNSTRGGEYPPVILALVDAVEAGEQLRNMVVEPPGEMASDLKKIRAYYSALSALEKALGDE